jgi:polyvinyl alcohol dehydrogenase (cytochrome)
MTHATWRRGLLAVAAGALVSTAIIASGAAAPAQASGDWTTYLGGLGRTGYNGAESTITAATAPNLKLQWSTGSPGDIIFSQPIVTNGMVYWGSFDGYEHATTTSGTLAWQQYLGQTPAGHAWCQPPVAGVASTATVSDVPVGTSTSVLYVGGGDAQMYALDAQTGAILWTTRLGASPANFLWGSPAVYDGSVYIGVASYGDCPLVQGQLVQLDAVTGAVQHVFKTVPDGCIGAGVWSSPTVDAVNGTVYFATGNSAPCSSPGGLGESIIELNASDLSLVGSWTVPASLAPGDSDFGATATLFSYTSSGQLHNLVGLANKNGIFYAFNRDALPAGPLWQHQVGRGGPSPESGRSDISPSAWNGTLLYVAGESGKVNGVRCPGTITALRPSNGRMVWRDCLPDGPVLSAVTAIPGVVTVGEGSHIVLLSATTGSVLLSFPTTAPAWGAASISDGVLYQGDIGGTLYALAP